MRVTKLKLTEQRPNVAVGIPMLEFIPRSAFYPFLFVAQYLTPRDRIMPIQRSADPATTRNQLITDFLDLPDDIRFLFLFDSDMQPPNNIVDVFARYNLPFVSGYCTHKSYPYMPIPAMQVGTTRRDGETIYEYRAVTNWEVNSGVRQCDATGAAAICVRRDVLEKMNPPYFKFEGGGEDLYFCRKVQRIATHDFPGGAPIFVDTGAVVGHIGEIVGTPQRFFEHKAEWMAEHPEAAEIDLVPLRSLSAG